MICTEIDDFLNEEIVFKPIWHAELSNGLVAHQDDNRPGTQDPAWMRLGQYIEETGVKIRKFWLTFRNAKVDIVPDDAEGYFFIKSVSAVWGHTDTMHFWLFGYLKGEDVYIKKYKVPECGVFDQEVRHKNDCLHTLIINK